MFHLLTPAVAEQVIKKSRFRAVALPVTSEADLRAAFAAHVAADANHNCWAWRIGSAYRSSDDGEPSGTAGRPILAAIDGRELDRVLVIVSRWFGGVLLGAGGLMRAYGGTAAQCLRAASLVEAVSMLRGTVALTFADLALVRARLETVPGLVVVDASFDSQGACLTVDVPEALAHDIARLVTDLSCGRAGLSLP